MKELRRLLDEDPKCVGKYEIVHYKESDSLKFSDMVLTKLKNIESQSATSTVVPNRDLPAVSPIVVEDGLKKNQ